jgi:hypothetical protein
VKSIKNVFYFTQNIISIYDLFKKFDELFYIVYFNKSLKHSAYFMLTVHLNSDKPHFKCSVATVITVFDSTDAEYPHLDTDPVVSELKKKSKIQNISFFCQGKCSHLGYIHTQ